MLGTIAADLTMNFSATVHHERSARFGLAAELLTVAWLEALLPGCRITHEGTGYGADVKIVNRETGEITRVEVKAARKGKDGKYRATTTKYGHTDARQHSDIIVFWVVTPDGIGVPFILKTADHKQTFLVVSSAPKSYKGKLAQYRSNIAPIMALRD